MPILRGGGAGSHPPPNRVIRKQMVKLNTRHGSSGWPGALLKMSNFHMATVHQIYTVQYYYFWPGKTTIARIDSQQYNTSQAYREQRMRLLSNFDFIFLHAELFHILIILRWSNWHSEMTECVTPCRLCQLEVRLHVSRLSVEWSKFRNTAANFNNYFKCCVN